MIGRVYRGSRVGGLVRYLYGPGRHNEHVEQRLVACWSGTTPQELAVVEPECTASGEPDFRGLIAELEAPMAYAERLDANPVWHCPLRTAPDDRILSDAEWADIAADLMHRTGIAPRGDEGACRWIAVRHDDESIHVVALLARQDGGRAHVFRDYLRVRETCLAAEQKYGLTVTAPADRSAATHTSRAEVEKAVRAGHAQPARDWLREQVQYAAAGAREPREFLDRLRVAGVAVRERRDPAGQLAGYAVGRRESGKQPVFFGGGKLASDLTLPKLQARWTGAAGPQAEAGAPSAREPERAQLWKQATEATALPAEQVRQHAHSGDVDGMAGAGDAVAAAAEVLSAASRLVEGASGGPLTQAARDYDRAAREVRGRLPRPTPTGTLLRTAALQLARAGKSGRRTEAAQIALLAAQIGSLSLSVGRLREAQGRAAQAAAARRASMQVAASADRWVIENHREVRVQEGQAALLGSAAPGARTTTLRASTTLQGPGRSR